MNYYPPGSPPTGRVNPNSYFVLNKSEFVVNNHLEFTNSNATDESKIHIDIGFSSEVAGKKINIYKITRLMKYSSGGQDHTITKTPSLPKQLFGSFHMYQALSLTGFKPNLELSIPNKSAVPAFLFRYAEEFDALVQFDAAISLAVNLTVEALALFFSGGSSALADLAFLQEFTEIGIGLTGPTNATELVTVFTDIETGANIIQATAGSLASVNNYLISTSLDENERKILMGYQQLFLLFMFLSSGTSLVARARISSIVNEVKPLIVDPSKYHPLLIDILDKIPTNTAKLLSDFQTILENLELDGADNEILAKYLDFTIDKKLVFQKTFKDLSAIQWKIFNGSADGTLFIDNWISLYDNNIAASDVFSLVTNSKRVAGALRFYPTDALRQIFESTPEPLRLKALEELGDINKVDEALLTKLKQKPAGMQLLIDSIDPAKAAVRETDVLKYVFNTANAKLIINSALDAISIRLLAIRNVLTWDEVRESFAEIRKDNDSLSDLENLYFQNASLLPSELQDEIFLNRNKMYVKELMLDEDGNPLGEPVERAYVSSDQSDFNKMSGANSAFSSIYTQPADNVMFRTFAKQAFDDMGKNRFTDTELKWLYDFMTNRYSSASHFKISVESVLTVSGSCQRYLVALKKLAELDGKTIEIEITAHPKAFRMPKVRELLNINN